MAETQRNSAVITDIAGCRHRTVGETVDHNALIKQPRGKRLIDYFMRMRDWIPKGSERSPVALGEGAFPRQGGYSRKIRGQNFRS